MMGRNHRNQTKVHLRENATLLILTVNGDVVQDSHEHDTRRWILTVDWQRGEPKHSLALLTIIKQKNNHYKYGTYDSCEYTYMFHVFVMLSCNHDACNIIVLYYTWYIFCRKKNSKSTRPLFLGVLSKLLGIPNNRQAPKGGLHGTAAEKTPHATCDAANVAAAAAATAMRWRKSNSHEKPGNKHHMREQP